MSLDDIKIEVFYKNEEDFKNHDVPEEIIMTSSTLYGSEPLVFSEKLPSCFNIRDTTEEAEINKDLPPDKYFRTAAIDLYGTVNYYVLNKDNKDE